MTTVQFKIKRQFSPEFDPYWEKFEIPHSPNSNVISYLMDIRKNPVNVDGVKVALEKLETGIEVKHSLELL